MNNDFVILDSTEDTGYNVRTRGATVRFGNAGHITFSTAAVTLLKLKSGMRISFMYNPDDPEILYFYEDKYGLYLQKHRDTTHGCMLLVSSKPHVNKIQAHFKFKSQSRTFFISNTITDVNGKKCWFVLKDKVRPTHYQPKR
jgi:hypothetical protein